MFTVGCYDCTMLCFAKNSLFKNFAQLAGAVEYTVSLLRDKTPTPNECPEYDTKQSDGEVPVMLSLPRQLWPRVVAPERALSMG